MSILRSFCEFRNHLYHASFTEKGLLKNRLLSWDLSRSFSLMSFFCRLVRCNTIMEELKCKLCNKKHVKCTLLAECQNHRKAEKNTRKIKKIYIQGRRKLRLWGHKDLYELTPSSLKLAVLPSLSYLDILNYLIYYKCIYKVEPLNVVKVCLKLIEGMALVRHTIGSH